MPQFEYSTYVLVDAETETEAARLVNEFVEAVSATTEPCRLYLEETSPTIVDEDEA